MLLVGYTDKGEKNLKEHKYRLLTDIVRSIFSFVLLLILM